MSLCAAMTSRDIDLIARGAGGMAFGPSESAWLRCRPKLASITGLVGSVPATATIVGTASLGSVNDVFPSLRVLEPSTEKR
ncbi:MAG: hypothetical protein M3N49_00645 [Candidatus Eremiobacteraeota bacterium]|nr:hypothetical protein [Candidatus Eremiobacteraeota bacterium]